MKRTLLLYTAAVLLIAVPAGSALALEKTGVPLKTELGLVYADSAASIHYAGTLDASATSPEAVMRQRIQRLSSVGSAAWPTVREYIWETCFARNDLFVGYADSLPGREDGSTVSFHLMVDRDVWSGMDSTTRQEKWDESRDLVAARLAAVNLRGSLEIVLVSR